MLRCLGDVDRRRPAEPHIESAYGAPRRGLHRAAQGSPPGLPIDPNGWRVRHDIIDGCGKFTLHVRISTNIGDSYATSNSTPAAPELTRRVAVPLVRGAVDLVEDPRTVPREA